MSKSAFTRDGLDDSIWELIDDGAGRTYRSISTHLPVKWEMGRSESGHLTYTSGDYVITRLPCGKFAWAYEVHRKGKRVGHPLHPRLLDAKRDAYNNARGGEVIHFA